MHIEFDSRANTARLTLLKSGIRASAQLEACGSDVDCLIVADEISTIQKIKGNSVEISQSKPGFVSFVIDQGAEFKLKAIPFEEIENTVFFENQEYQHSLTTNSRFSEIVKEFSAFTDKGDPKAICKNIHIQDGSMYATDGHKMAYVSGIIGKSPEYCALPIDMVKMISKHTDSSKYPVRLHYSDSSVKVAWEFRDIKFEFECKYNCDSDVVDSFKKLIQGEKENDYSNLIMRTSDLKQWSKLAKMKDVSTVLKIDKKRVIFGCYGYLRGMFDIEMTMDCRAFIQTTIGFDSDFINEIISKIDKEEDFTLWEVFGNEDISSIRTNINGYTVIYMGVRLDAKETTKAA